MSDNSSLEPDWPQDPLSLGTERAWGEILERACSVSQAEWEGGNHGGGKTRGEPDTGTGGQGRNGRLDLMY